MYMTIYMYNLSSSSPTIVYCVLYVVYSTPTTWLRVQCCVEWLYCTVQNSTLCIQYIVRHEWDCAVHAHLTWLLAWGSTALHCNCIFLCLCCVVLCCAVCSKVLTVTVPSFCSSFLQSYQTALDHSGSGIRSTSQSISITICNRTEQNSRTSNHANRSAADAPSSSKQSAADNLSSELKLSDSYGRSATELCASIPLLRWL